MLTMTLKKECVQNAKTFISTPLRDLLAALSERKNRSAEAAKFTVSAKGTKKKQKKSWLSPDQD